MRGLAGVTCAASGTDFWFVGSGAVVGQRGRVYLTNLEAAPAVVDVDALRPGRPDRRTRRPRRPGRARPAGGAAARRPGAGHHPVRRPRARPQGRIAAAVRDQQVDGLTPLGADWVPAALAPARCGAGCPGVPGGAGERRLQVVAPGDSDGIVRVRLVGESGAFAPAGLDVIEVRAGSVADVDIAEFAGGEPVTVELDSDVPVTAGVLGRADRGRPASSATSPTPRRPPPLTAGDPGCGGRTPGRQRCHQHAAADRAARRGHGPAGAAAARPTGSPARCGCPPGARSWSTSRRSARPQYFALAVDPAARVRPGARGPARSTSEAADRWSRPVRSASALTVAARAVRRRGRPCVAPRRCRRGLPPARVSRQPSGSTVARVEARAGRPAAPPRRRGRGARGPAGRGRGPRPGAGRRRSGPGPVRASPARCGPATTSRSPASGTSSTATSTSASSVAQRDSRRLDRRPAPARRTARRGSATPAGPRGPAGRAGRGRAGPAAGPPGTPAADAARRPRSRSHAAGVASAAAAPARACWRGCGPAGRYRSPVSPVRRCSRTACGRPAVATLTYVYAGLDGRPRPAGHLRRAALLRPVRGPLRAAHRARAAGRCCGWRRTRTRSARAATTSRRSPTRCARRPAPRRRGARAGGGRPPRPPADAAQPRRLTDPRPLAG